MFVVVFRRKFTEICNIVCLSIKREVVTEGDGNTEETVIATAHHSINHPNSSILSNIHAGIYTSSHVPSLKFYSDSLCTSAGFNLTYPIFKHFKHEHAMQNFSFYGTEFCKSVFQYSTEKWKHHSAFLYYVEALFIKKFSYDSISVSPLSYARPVNK